MNNKFSVSLRNQSFYIDYFDSWKSNKIMKTYHLHQDYEIFYLLEGECVYLINGKTWYVEKDQLVLISKNVMHKTRKVKGKNYARMVINFREDFLPEAEQELVHKLFHCSPPVVPIPVAKQSGINRIIQNLYFEYQNKENYLNLYGRTLLTQLLIESLRIVEEKGESSGGKVNLTYGKGSQDISEIVTYINNSFSSDVSLSSLSRQFHRNEQYISRLFKQVTGCNIVDYVNAVRINEAKRLLLETDMKIYQIAHRIGYSNPVHLWRVFTRITGTSPNQYREDHSNIEAETDDSR
ncbi:AraC-like ligand binding domain-containing protein [Halobacillus dabanensis]|uniref:AraC-like ligand binding domain-containing protein n=1 Tax=Halobacillus dabanensis TaxID=240302 RepID=A0A1I3V0V6_HALDA|nr:helix-turn-helix domain-containing protein [Halobacillus dabanensis]SFJ89304.1 AraC-like ligand binding domain-containing protein [Halobacillus dabanensis]